MIFLLGVIASLLVVAIDFHLKGILNITMKKMTKTNKPLFKLLE